MLTIIDIFLRFSPTIEGGQHLVESFEDAGGDTGRLLIKPAGEIAQQPFGSIAIVELPSLPEHPAYRCMQRLGQPLDHIAGFMNLAALDRRVGAEGATDGSLSRHASMDCDQNRCAVRGCFV